LKFSDYIKVPRNANEWAGSNEGSLRLTIGFEPSNKSLDVFEEAHVRCNWFVESLLDLKEANGSNTIRYLKQEQE
jgi:hypothetical protein